MNVTMIVLRLIHVLSGVFWAGATFVLASHITPTVKATGPEGQKFMQHLAGKANISNAFAISGGLAFLSGLIMYFIQRWETNASASGIVLTLGALFGTAALLHGSFVQRKAILNIQALGKKIATSGGPPSPEEGAELGRMSAKIEKNGQILAYILALTVVLMATFQYF